MWRAPRRFPLVPVAIGAIVVLLGTLASLQYRWAGELSAAEHARLRASARSRVEAMGRDFDGEVSRGFRSLGLYRDEVAARDYTAFPARFEDWRKSSPWPRLVRDVYVVDAESGAPALQRYVPEDAVFQPTEWTAELEPVRRRLARNGGGPGGMIEPIVEEIPALVVRPFGREGAAPPRPPTDGPPGPDGRGAGPGRDARLVLVVLDRSVILGEVLPALAARHFGADFAREQDLRVVRQRDRETGIWSSRPEAALTPRVDAAAGLLELRSEPGPSGSRGMPGFPARPYGEDSGRWRLEAANRAGPLEDVVAAARLRNLTVGLGVLGLLLAAVLLVVVTAGRAQRLADRQMQFVAAVSHELRTPLAVITSTSENLADGVVRDPTRVRQYGGVIRDQGRRLAEMIEDVLSFAGASSPDRRRRDDEVAVADLVDEALRALEPALHDRGFTVERTVAEGMPTVRGDAAHLRLALRNLVENAMKYDAGSRWLAVGVSLDDGPPSGIVIRVRDRGPGIAAEDLPHVFEPFYRGRLTHDGRIHGFGLGLALVRRTVEDHGGRVSVDSLLGHGTTFTIRLPAAAASAASAENGVNGLPDPAR